MAEHIGERADWTGGLGHGGEREAGRLAALDSLPRARQRLWSPRVLLRAGGVALALLLPLAVGGLIEGTAPLRLAAAAGLVLLSLAFWMIVTLAVARLPAASATQAAVLAGLWFAIPLVIPAGTHLAINAAVEQQSAATQEIARNTNEAANGAQDVSRNISDVLFGAQQTGEASKNVVSAAQELGRQSVTLQQEVQTFLTSVRAS
jgi:hypothetical protein